MVRPQRLKALGDIGLAEPFDLVLLAASQDIQTVRCHKLNGARAILADMGDKREDVACRDLEFGGPPGEHAFIVRQQSPEKGFRYRAAVLFGAKRHGERQRIDVRCLPPFVVIDELDATARIALHAADFFSVQEGDEFVGHGLRFLALATIESISMAAERRRWSVTGAVLASRWMSRTSMVREARELARRADGHAQSR